LKANRQLKKKLHISKVEKVKKVKKLAPSIKGVIEGRK